MVLPERSYDAVEVEAPPASNTFLSEPRTSVQDCVRSKDPRQTTQSLVANCMNEAGHDARDVIRRELELLAPAIRRDPAAMRERLHPAFREFGASGRVWDLASILTSLPGAVDEPAIVAHELESVRLADDVILLTYLAERGGRRSRRSSVWERTEGSWRCRFHQGTPVT